LEVWKTWNLSARIGIEGLPSATDASQVYKSTEAGGSFSLTFPQFALPLGSGLKRRLGNINPKDQGNWRASPSPIARNIRGILSILRFHI
jgi:hypothetical protein